MPKAFQRTTLAVFRPTPGRAVSPSRVRGTSPPWRSTMARQQPITLRALLRKKPVGRIVSSSSAGSASARSFAVRYRRKRVGVTWLTRSSVHWAARMVAISSWSGVLKSSITREPG